MSDARLFDSGAAGALLKWLLAAVIFSLLVGCATTPAPRPEPIVEVREVRVPVPVPCDALDRIGPPPAYPDTDAALAAAPDILAQVRLLLAGRVLKNDRLATVEDALAACR